MKRPTTAKSQGNTKVKKLALKKEKLADLSPRAGAAELVRGQSIGYGGGRGNHNETLVRLVAR